ncbi:hypothetical protein V2I71_19890 [Peribacillus frigoritolerans]|uniref:hypothetical protein n=1 Tax=Peribacillus frigoritolerans TaxID=450367 RepID=UPI002ED3B25E|nr:hypothetical protein V2I71_19890 [Peribacillus frigoritolerans]
MILKAFRRNKLVTVTVNYYIDGAIQTLKGRVHNLDLSDQTLSLEDENKNIFFSGLQELKKFIKEKSTRNMNCTSHC